MVQRRIHSRLCLWSAAVGVLMLGACSSDSGFCVAGGLGSSAGVGGGLVAGLLGGVSR